jgi:hypothetical protein
MTTTQTTPADEQEYTITVLGISSPPMLVQGMQNWIHWAVEGAISKVVSSALEFVMSKADGDNSEYYEIRFHAVIDACYSEIHRFRPEGVPYMDTATVHQFALLAAHAGAAVRDSGVMEPFEAAREFFMMMIKRHWGIQ